MKSGKDLPLVKPRGKMAYLPDSDTITKCMQFKSEGALSYLYNRLVSIFDAAKMRTESIEENVLKPIAAYRDYIISANSGGDIWGGKAPPDAYLEFLLKDAVKAFDVVKEKAIDFDFAISDDSEFVRRYAANGNDLDSNASQAMDDIFNAWLAENKMFSRGGVIYEGTPATQTPVRASAETLREKVVDKKSGVAAFVDTHYKSMKLNANQLEYPKREGPDSGPSAAGTSGAGSSMAGS